VVSQVPQEGTEYGQLFDVELAAKRRDLVQGQRTPCRVNVVRACMPGTPRCRGPADLFIRHDAPREDRHRSQSSRAAPQFLRSRRATSTEVTTSGAAACVAGPA